MKAGSAIDYCRWHRCRWESCGTLMLACRWWFVLIVCFWAKLLMLFATTDSAGGFKRCCCCRRSQLITANRFDPTLLRMWRAIMRFLARETHIMTSFANYVCDQNIQSVLAGSFEKFGSQSYFLWHCRLFRVRPLMMSLCCVDDDDELLLRSTFFLSICHQPLLSRNLSFRRKPREKLQQKLYLSSSVCHRKWCLGKILTTDARTCTVAIFYGTFFSKFS